MTQSRSADGSGSSRTRWSLPLSLGLYGLAAASLLGACLYFFLAHVPGRRAAAIKAWQQELALRADLRKATLDRWVAVGMADAETLASFPSPRALIASGAGAAATGRLAENVTRLRDVVESFTRIRGYQRFVLLDSSLRIAIETGESRSLEPPTLQAAAEVLARGKTAVDFHRHADGSVAVGFLARVGTTGAPRANDGGGLPSGGGVVLLETDPSQWLYPYLAMRPMAAASAETLLVKGDGDDIVFLSPLRHNPAPPLTFRRPANAAHFAAAAALAGRGEVDAFVDYRNEPVLAAVARLDRAPWGIVVKVDEREALATFRQEIRHTGATAVAAMLAFWALVFLLVLGWRRRAEAALREGEERYRATLYSIGDAVIATDRHGRVKQMNPVAEKLTGWTESQASGRPLDEVFRIVNEQTHAVVESPVARVLREGQVIGLANHTLLISKDGNEHPIADSGAPIRNEKGETTGVVLVFRDQTEERAAQKALKESEAFNRTIVESIPQQLFLKDRNGVYLAVNQPYAASLGCRPEQLVGKDDFAFYPTELAEKYRADDRAVVESGQVKDMEERYLAQGKEYWIHTIKAPVRDYGGQVTAVLGLFEDISARQRVEQSLKDARDRLEEAQRAAHLGNWEFDVLNDQITGSEEFYRLFDVAPERLSRFSQFVERLHPDDRERVQRDVADALKQNRPYDTDYRVRLSDGGWRDIIARGRVFVDEGGKPLRMVGTCLDITERKRMEESLRESEARFRDTFERSTVGQSLTGRDGKLLNVNQAFADMLGLSIEELQQVTAAQITHPDDVAETQECIRSLFAGERTAYRMEKRYRHRDGHFVFADMSTSLLRDDHGAPLCLITSVVDISARKRTEEELRFRNVVLTTQQESSIDGILVVDVNGKMVSSNGRFAEMWGIPSDIMESRSDERALQSVMEKLADPEGFISEVKRLYATPDEKSRDEIALKDGRTFDRYSAPMLDADKKCFGRVWHFRDITEQKRIAAALAAANSELERRVAERTAELTVANRELESFSSSVSHDLRAPLRGIDGWSQAVLEDCGPQLDERGRTYLKRVRSETQRMGELIDGLLELSCVTRAPMKRETVDLTAMAQELEASLRARQPERAVDFVVAPGMVAEGDAVLLRAVLQNLLGNAWKFTGKRPRARIEVGCTSEQGRTVYHVRDDGAGFDMRYVGKLFAPFQRLHSLDEFPGTGIGLATVQRIIHRHGSKVWATAEVDQGATFYFTLTA